MSFTRIADQDFNGKGARSLPDQPTISASELKRVFDEDAREVVAPKVNTIVGELEANSAAASLGATAPSGRTGNTVQAVMNSISSGVDAKSTITLSNVSTSGVRIATVIIDGASTDLKAPQGGQGTMDYDDLTDKPQINSNTLSGNKSSSDLGLAAASHTHSASDITSGLATVATTGDYTDLSNTPNLATVATSGSYGDLSNTPTLATVATSGSYSDLSNTPNIPTVVDQYNATSSNAMSGKAVAQAIATKSNVSVTQVVQSGTKIATISVDGVGTDIYESGGSAAVAYDKAKVGSTTLQATAGNTTLELKAGSNVTLTPNASDNSVTIAASGGGQSTGDMLMSDYDPNATIKNTAGGIPTYVSNAISGKADSSSLATVATSGDYTDLSNTPTLATVATSGSYADLSNKPSIPAAQVSSDWNATTGVAKILNKPTIPDDLSDLSDDSTHRLVTDTEKSTWNAKVSDYPVFTEASTRANIASGESFATILGKIKKFFSDIKALAFINTAQSDPTTKYLRGDGSWQTFPSIPTNLSDLTGDVSISSPSDDEFLRHNGTKWVNESVTIPTVSVAGNGTASTTVVHSQQITVNSTSTDIDGTKYMESTANSASFVFTNSTHILSTSAISVYTDTWGDNPSNVAVDGSNHTCTVTFGAAKSRTVRIYIR